MLLRAQLDQLARLFNGGYNAISSLDIVHRRQVPFFSRFIPRTGIYYMTYHAEIFVRFRGHPCFPSMSVPIRVISPLQPLQTWPPPLQRPLPSINTEWMATMGRLETR